MDEYLESFRCELEKVYYLNSEGRKRVNCDVIRKKTQNIEHFLLRNQLYIHVGKPRTWENEVKLTAGDISIICDAKFIKNGIPAFVEVDISQPMTVNRAKMEKYKKLAELTGERFFVVWVTSLESRLPKLNELMDGMTGKVYTAKEIK